MTLFALGKLGGDEFGCTALRHFLVEARGQLIVELGVAEQIPRFEERGADRHVGLGLANRFID